MKKILIFLLIISILPIKIFAKEQVADVTKNAKSAIVIEATTGEVLYNKNANEIRSIASLTKMMGLILIFEAMEQGGLEKDEIITISKNAKDMGGSQIWLEEGEQISVDDLIKGITLASANELAVLIKQSHLLKEEIII